MCEATAPQYWATGRRPRSELADRDADAIGPPSDRRGRSPQSVRGRTRGSCRTRRRARTPGARRSSGPPPSQRRTSRDGCRRPCRHPPRTPRVGRRRPPNRDVGVAPPGPRRRERGVVERGVLAGHPDLEQEDERVAVGFQQVVRVLPLHRAVGEHVPLVGRRVRKEPPAEIGVVGERPGHVPLVCRVEFRVAGVGADSTAGGSSGVGETAREAGKRERGGARKEGSAVHVRRLGGLRVNV